MKIELFSTPNFDAWLDDLKDGQGRAAILKRLNRKRGQAADIKQAKALWWQTKEASYDPRKN